MANNTGINEIFEQGEKFLNVSTSVTAELYGIPDPLYGPPPTEENTKIKCFLPMLIIIVYFKKRKKLQREKLQHFCFLL